MANIRKRIKSDGTESWQVQVRRAKEKPIVKSFPTIHDAERFAQVIERELDKGIVQKKPDAEAVNLAKFKSELLVDTIAKFIRSDDVLPRHLNLTPTICTHIGNVKNGDMRRSWVKTFIGRMRMKISKQGRPYSDQTIATMVQTINVILRWRSDDLELPQPPVSVTVKGIKGKWSNKRTRRLNAEEQEALTARLARIESSNREHWELLVLLALETAARRSELVLAEWSEFEIERKLWTIPAEHTKLKIERAVPLSIEAVRIVSRLKELASDASPRVFHALGSKPHNVSACFHRYVEQAGLANFRFHDLRHEAISRMVLYKRKFSVFELMRIVGHASTEMFHRYANLRGDELADRME